MNRFGKSLIAVVVTLRATLWSASSWAQLLKVGSHEPWVVQDIGSNGPSGLFVDLVNAVAKDAGLKVDYQVMKFADLIPAVTTGKIDIIATMMAITSERKQQVDFSIPIYNPPTEAVVFSANDMTSYKALTDFQGLPVGAQKGSIQLALLQRTGGFSEIKTTMPGAHKQKGGVSPPFPGFGWFAPRESGRRCRTRLVSRRRATGRPTWCRRCRIASKTTPSCRS
jgi:polar amino acid transport system substrate-binding protein